MHQLRSYTTYYFNSGGLFTPLWLGRPTAMIANDLCFGACILAYWIVYWTPFDIGYKLCRTFPVALITTLFAELFRVCGIVNFCNAAFDAFKDKPSVYYPIPVFGPIFYATILGNMGPLFVSGFHSYLGNGMPWGFQKGLVCSSFYHFYAHDTTGIIGTQLRRFVKTYFFMSTEQHGLDDRVLPIVVISAFMHIVAVLQMPQLLGPTFSPFTMLSLPKRRTSSPQSIEKQVPAQKDVRQTQAAVSRQKLEPFSKRTPDLGEENQVKEVIPSNGEAKEVDGKKKKRKKKGGNKKED